jgi:uncharacterized membrane protein YcaP (DUF421 family)
MAALERYGSLSCISCGYDYRKAEDGEEETSMHPHYTVRAFKRIIRNTCEDCHPQFKMDRELAEQEWSKEEADVKSQEID